MTAVVGILCKDGIVIGTDSSATFGASNVRTIEQPAKKITIIENRVIVAGTGQVGLDQRFCDIVKNNFVRHIYKKPYLEVGKILCTETHKDFISTNVPANQYGAIIGYATDNKFHLCEFAIKDFQPEFKTESIWYVSMGCGQQITDPFLGLMRRVFWKDSLPGVADATFVATWTLQHAIDLNPGGINSPVQMAVIRNNPENGKYVAHLLTDSELQEHINNVNAAEEYLSKYKGILLGVDTDLEVPEVDSTEVTCSPSEV